MARLQVRIEIVESDITAGKNKTYYADMLAELQEKQETLKAMSSGLTEFIIPETYLTMVRHDIQVLRETERVYSGDDWR